MRNAVYISTYRTVRTTHVLRINSRFKSACRCSRSDLPACADRRAAAIMSTNADRKRMEGGRKYVWMQCVNKLKPPFRFGELLILLEPANT